MQNSANIKVCCTCKEPKPLASFYKDCSQKDQLGRSCKACQAVTQKRYRANAKKKAEISARSPLSCQGERILRVKCPNCDRKLHVSY